MKFGKDTRIFFKKHRFFVLLISLLLTMVLYPIVSALGMERTSRMLDVFVGVILLSSVNAVAVHRGTLRIAILLVLPAILSIGASYLWNIRTTDFTREIFLALYLSFVAVTILKHVLGRGKVTFEKISAALCVYLLIGVLWASLYQAAIVVEPASFQGVNPEKRELVYFSFITLTTLGYGDITPKTPPAQALCYVEALCGQLYLAVLVARLVALHIIHSQDQQEPSD